MSAVVNPVAAVCGAEMGSVGGCGWEIAAHEELSSAAGSAGLRSFDDAAAPVWMERSVPVSKKA